MLVTYISRVFLPCSRLLREADPSSFLGNKYYMSMLKILLYLLFSNDKRTLSVKGILCLITLHTKKKFHTTVICQVLQIEVLN